MFINREKQLQQQRQRENLVHYVNQTKVDTQRIKWQESTPSNKQKIEYLKRDFKNKVKLNLEARSKRLQVLLTEEHKQYMDELRGIVSQPQNSIEIMREKVAQLRERNEAERQAEVAKLKEAQFRANEDELREFDYKAKEMRAQISREIQMLEKQKRLEADYEENMAYAEMHKQQLEEREMEEKALKEAQIAKLEERNAILAAQLTELKKEREEELRNLHRENEEFRKTWSLAEKRAQDEQLRQKELNRRVAEEIKKHNLMQKMQKETEFSKQKLNDKQLVERLLQREETLKRLEDEQKKKYQQQIREFFQTIVDRSKEVEINQKALDELLKRESEKQWEKRMTVWKKEENMRIKLMREVYAHRYEDIQGKKRQKLDELENKKKEQVEVLGKVEEYKQEEAKLLLDEVKRVKSYKGEIDKQLAEKYILMQRELMARLEEERKMKLKELEREEKLAEERKKNQQLLEELARIRDNVY